MRSLTIERSMTIILFALIFALATRVPVDTDTWWHIRSGEYTLTHGMIYADPFSFTKAGRSPGSTIAGDRRSSSYVAWKIGGQLRAVDLHGGAGDGGHVLHLQDVRGQRLPARLRADPRRGDGGGLLVTAPADDLVLPERGRALSALSLSTQADVDRLWLIPIIMGGVGQPARRVLDWLHLHGRRDRRGNPRQDVQPARANICRGGRFAS